MREDVAGFVSGRFVSPSSSSRSNRGLVQLVERDPHTVYVVGSSPTPATKLSRTLRTTTNPHAPMKTKGKGKGGKGTGKGCC